MLRISDLIVNVDVEQSAAVDRGSPDDVVEERETVALVKWLFAAVVALDVGKVAEELDQKLP